MDLPLLTTGRRFWHTALLFLSVLTLPYAHAAAEDLAGRVTYENVGLYPAQVRVKATTISATTDQMGQFVLQGITTPDTVIVTAWSEGYYNGEAKAVAGDTSAVVVLHPLPEQDNPDYVWLSPAPDGTESLQCGNCHGRALMDQWQNNAHAKSATNPFFLAMYYGTDTLGTANTGVGYKSDFEHTQGTCATCHIPGAAVANPWGVDPQSVTGVSRNGVFCDFCHKIKRVKAGTGQGTAGVLSIELLRPPDGAQMFFGPFDDIHEPDSYLPLIRKSEFCAPCHTAKFWGVPAYSTFPEWQASPYPEMGIECQSCHMAPDGVTTNFAPGKGGVERDPYTIPSHSQPGSRDPDFLSRAVTMTLSAEQRTDTLMVRAVVVNDQTGHHVPAGRPSRNMILLVNAVDTASVPMPQIGGEQVPSWGGEGDITEQNYAGEPGKGFAKVMEDFNGISPAPSWRPSRILSDNRIAAFAADTSYYAYRIPEGVEHLSISARLFYRRFYKPWMDEKRFEIPDILMAHEALDVVVTSLAGQMDFDGDGGIDFQDFIVFAQHFGQTPEDPGFDVRFDLNRSGRVDFQDFIVLAQHFR